MDVYDEEFVRFWSAMYQRKVDYIMVGGFAANIHGYSRQTDDIDVWLKDTTDNRKRLRQAMQDYSSIDYFIIDNMQIVTGWTYFYLNNGTRLDLMIEMKGLEQYTFDDCLEAATIAIIKEVPIPFLHINHLLENKRAVNRLKDQLDVEQLEKIKKLMQEEEDRTNNQS